MRAAPGGKKPPGEGLRENLRDGSVAGQAPPRGCPALRGCPGTEKNQPPLPPLVRGARKIKTPQPGESASPFHTPLVGGTRKSKTPSTAVGAAFSYPPDKGGGRGGCFCPLTRRVFQQPPRRSVRRPGKNGVCVRGPPAPPLREAWPLRHHTPARAGAMTANAGNCAAKPADAGGGTNIFPDRQGVTVADRPLRLSGEREKPPPYPP